MSLERAISNHFSGCHPLTAELPAAKFYTGMAPVKIMQTPEGAPVLDTQGQPVYELLVDLPFCNIERTGTGESVRLSGGTILEVVQIRWDIWDLDLDRAKRIARLIRERFNRVGPISYDGGTLNDCKFTGQAESQDNQATWHVVLDSIMRTAETPDMAGVT